MENIVQEQDADINDNRHQNDRVIVLSEQPIDFEDVEHDHDGNNGIIPIFILSTLVTPLTCLSYSCFLLSKFCSICINPNFILFKH